jgi:hypothetical protein
MSITDEPRTIGGRYRLDRAIGRGGMGTVWAGHDEVLGRSVAVKEVRFPPELGPQEVTALRERTLREARATARLSHPNVITTYDVVDEDDRPWIVMELLSARTLDEVIRADGALPPHRVAEIGLGVLAALEAAHAQGVVHRDVKPSNVLVLDDGRVVLTDFGIATVAGDPALTSTGVVLGSPAYLPPERARGGQVGPAGDLWSLGATLYAAAEGRPPYDAIDALSTLTAVVSDPVPPMRTGGDLAEAVHDLLQKDPAQRAGIEVTKGRLTRAARDLSPAAAAPAATVALSRADQTSALRGGTPPPPPRVDPEEQEDRRGGLLTAGLVVALLLVAGLVVAAVLAGRDDGDPGAGPTQTPTTSEPAESTPSTSAPETSTSAPPDDGLPAGFTLYEDPSGFAVAVPDGWVAQQESDTIVDIEEPGGSRFLRFDQTNEPAKDPVKDWEQLEKSVSEDLPNYQRIGINEVDYRGWPAADWEFTFGDGSTTHVIDRGFVPSENQGYAIYLSSPDEQWQDSLGIFQTAADTFEPAPADASGGDEDDND